MTATHCNTCACNTLQHTHRGNEHITATYCNTYDCYQLQTWSYNTLQHTHCNTHTATHTLQHTPWYSAHCYGVATISRLLKIISLFCKRALYKRLYSAKETYNFQEPTSRSHPIGPFNLEISFTKSNATFFSSKNLKSLVLLSLAYSVHMWLQQTYDCNTHATATHIWLQPWHAHGCNKTHMTATHVWHAVRYPVLQP